MEKGKNGNHPRYEVDPGQGLETGKKTELGQYQLRTVWIVASLFFTVLSLWEGNLSKVFFFIFQGFLIYPIIHSKEIKINGNESLEDKYEVEDVE